MNKTFIQKLKFQNHSVPLLLLSSSEERESKLPSPATDAPPPATNARPPTTNAAPVQMDVITCHCGKRSRLKTSWTDHNPGRRFLGCPQYGSVGACGFFSWVDPPLCARARQIIPGLLRRTNDLQAKLQVHRRREKWFIVCIVMSWIFFWWWQVNVYA
ncbi:uncharacterized protein LOC130755079 [Actinidia eriantha]|uniref:uncharacterized protein LOC130755079 n=1 Tax=Actinidia eriantha TaxID=165200 RepID=UPI002588D7AD|nr:uncharacterized protein LOC130755079 [Actinidia eriantha]